MSISKMIICSLMMATAVSAADNIYGDPTSTRSKMPPPSQTAIYKAAKRKRGEEMKRRQQQRREGARLLLELENLRIGVSENENSTG